MSYGYGTKAREQHLSEQIERLSKFILSLDCGFPTINDEYPQGMGACEAAEEYIKWLRQQIARRPAKERVPLRPEKPVSI